MKIPLLVTLTFLPCLALAQSTTDTSDTPSTNQPSASGQPQEHHHFRSPDQQLAWLTAKLTLSDIQQGQIKPVLVSRDEQLKAIHENTSLTDEQKHEQVKELMHSTNQQIESFLNPAQVAEFKELHQHHDKPTPQP